MQTHPGTTGVTSAFAALERSVRAALETYANVHRGSGHHSVATTRLFEQARDIVLEHMGLDDGRHVVVFGSPRSIDTLTAQLSPARYRVASSGDIGLPLGVRALAVERDALPAGAPSITGGGTARLVGRGWVMWAPAPGRFEAGTPAIINVIAYARALQLAQQFGAGAFTDTPSDTLTPAQILRHDALEGCSGRDLLHALRQTLIGGGGRVPTQAGERTFINLDNGASTPTFEPVWTAACQAWRQPTDARHAIVEAVAPIVSDVVGAPTAAYDVIFTANTTEAINLVAESVNRQAAPGVEPVVVNTLLEHNSNELPWRRVGEASPLRLGMDAGGFVDAAELETLLRTYNERAEHGAKRITLVAVTGASNVLGVCNDLAAIGQLAHRYGARLLVDGAQLVAHRRVAVDASGIDYLAFSAHKAYAPFGTGVLVARKGLLTFSTAEMDAIRASGDENVVGITALGKALVLLQRIGFDVIRDEEQALTARALRGMAQIPGVEIYGIADPASPAFAHKGGVIAFNLKDRIAHTIGRELAARGGIGVRSGCHCAHLTVKRLARVPPWAEQFQRVILTVLSRIELPGVARVSLGLENTDDDIDTLIAVLDDIARQPKGGRSKRAARQRMDGYAEAAAQRVFC
ncbi:MAG: aminotransferase class V-fold PLP-dependent enzyme [Acidobacteria bacterium]|nr:aminotransferase class V-fold PLP-dependent enzyme [Acidobacteriota bacterium]